MPKQTTYFLGRAQLLILLIAGVVIIFGLFTFLTSHETLNQEKFLKDEDGNSIKALFLTTRPSDNSQKPTRFVNGQNKPVISIRPGEIQRWKIVNESQDTFHIFLGGVDLLVVAKNGEIQSPGRVVEQEVLEPAESMEALITGPQWGNYVVYTIPTNEKESADYVTDEILVLKSEGIPKF